MIQVDTHGITVSVNEDAANDMRFIELLGKLDDGDIFAFPKLCRTLFGEDQIEKVYKAIETEDGRVPATAMVDLFTDVMAKAGAKLKN